MVKLKIGITGCGGGKIANQKHFPTLKANSDLNEIVAFCDNQDERADYVGQRLAQRFILV